MTGRTRRNSMFPMRFDVPKQLVAQDCQLAFDRRRTPLLVVCKRDGLLSSLHHPNGRQITTGRPRKSVHPAERGDERRKVVQLAVESTVLPSLITDFEKCVHPKVVDPTRKRLARLYFFVRRRSLCREFVVSRFAQAD